jgi:hypothetical protein
VAKIATIVAAVASVPRMVDEVIPTIRPGGHLQRQNNMRDR